MGFTADADDRAGFIGTRLGLLLLGRIPEATFQLILKGVLTLLAVMMIAASARLVLLPFLGFDHRFDIIGQL